MYMCAAVMTLVPEPLSPHVRYCNCFIILIFDTFDFFRSGPVQPLLSTKNLLLYIIYICIYVLKFVMSSFKVYFLFFPPFFYTGHLHFSLFLPVMGALSQT